MFLKIGLISNLDQRIPIKKEISRKCHETVKPRMFITCIDKKNSPTIVQPALHDEPSLMTSFFLTSKIVDFWPNPVNSEKSKITRFENLFEGGVQHSTVFCFLFSVFILYVQYLKTSGCLWKERTIVTATCCCVSVSSSLGGSEK